MKSKDQILSRIKYLVKQQESDATIILYGSFARGDNRSESDIDLLILLDKDKITCADEQKISYPLYELEFETGQIISPIIFGRNDWENNRTITPFYENVQREGIQL